MSDASRPREDDASQPRPPQPGLQPPIPVLPVSAHIDVPKAALSTVEELRELLTTPPTSRLDSTRIFFRVSREKLDEWDTVFGEKEDRAVLARDICVSHAVVDLDAIPAADVNALLTPGEELEVPSATVFRYTGTQWVKHTEKDVTMPIDLTSLLCLEPVHTFSHLHARIADAHKRGVTHLVTYSGAVWCPPCRRIMPYVAPIVAGVNKSNADKGVRIEVVKLDRDAAESIDQVYGVEYIPFFQVFQTSGIEQHLEAINHPLPPVMPEDRVEDEWNEKDIASARSLALKPLGSLQNSSNDGVTAFLERYCVPLNFNETF